MTPSRVRQKVASGKLAVSARSQGSWDRSGHSQHYCCSGTYLLARSVGFLPTVVMAMPHDVRAAAEPHHEEKRPGPEQKIQNIA